MQDSLPQHTSLLRIFIEEWKIWLSSAIVCFMLACFIMEGALWPTKTFHYCYSGDGLLYSTYIQRLTNGWFWIEPRMGWPFGSFVYDFPFIESFSFFLLKILHFSGGFPFAFNAFFVLTFALVFITSYCVLRGLGLSIYLSILCAVSYDFIPYHFMRIGRLTYADYSVFPLFFWIGYKIFINPYKELSFRHIILYMIAMIPMSCFTVYYSAFGCIILTLSGIAGSIRHQTFRNIVISCSLCMTICLTVTLNILPSKIYQTEFGINSFITNANRLPAESEIYGLKLIQLILPSFIHSNKTFSNITHKYYSQNFPLVNENRMSALGLLGGLGLFIVAGNFFKNMSGKKLDSKLSFFSFQTLFLFFMGTIGGGGSIFAFFVTPALRAWNRISICIAFTVLVILFLTFQNWIKKYNLSHRSILFIVLLLGTLVAWDQVPIGPLVPTEMQQNWDADKQFIESVEAALPPGAAIYQLPYIHFPEAPHLYNMPDYSQSIGYIHSKKLNFSYGSIYGREGDLFFHYLSEEPLSKQIEVIRLLGFSGICVDRRGYKDKGETVINELSARFGTPLRSGNGNNVFFILQRTEPAPTYSEASPLDIMQHAGYIVDHYGHRYSATLTEGIDFRKNSFPEFIHSVKGLSGPEPWGRWSDAKTEKTIRFTFTESLPKIFTIVLTAKAFGPNAGKECLLRVGGETYNRFILSDAPTTVRIPVTIKEERINVLEFIPPAPASPSSLKLGEDTRELGIGFINLSIK